MYVLMHEELTKALVDLAEYKTKKVTVKVAIDYKMIFCSGSTVKGLLAANPTIEVYVKVQPSYMMHHKYVIADDYVVMHGSGNFSHHALVSANIVAIHDDQCILEPSVAEFTKISNCKRYRRVHKDEISITTSCQGCIERAQLTGEVPKECVAVEPEVNIRAIEPIEFA